MLSDIKVILKNLNNLSATVRSMDVSYDTVNLEGFRLSNIDGLDPVKAEINTIASATDSGGDVTSTRAGGRTIDIMLDIDPYYMLKNGVKVSDIRYKLYNQFPVGSPIALQFRSDNVPGLFEITGWVEDVDSPMFSKDPKLSIMLYCPYPYFKDVEGFKEFVPTFDSEGNFEYDPYLNVSSGFEFSFTVVEGTGDLFQLTHKDSLVSLGVRYSAETGDRVKMSTIKGAKGVWYERSGVSNDVLHGYSGSLTDMKLMPSINHFRFSRPGITQVLNPLIKHNVMTSGF